MEPQAVHSDEAGLMCLSCAQARLGPAYLHLVLLGRIPGLAPAWGPFTVMGCPYCGQPLTKEE